MMIFHSYMLVITRGSLNTPYSAYMGILACTADISPVHTWVMYTRGDTISEVAMTPIDLDEIDGSSTSTDDYPRDD